ncbi:nuclear transport factor 2 family protein [Rhodohalobacter barkolensis]|uniref:Steroid delta-isomerase n=1 Tax=Rhodohalobacter barkolensis TaxID=2053187 RepID=A0A2N0VLZ9_9BACT|nr:nuclear transport factor 2 family protein [Rhodohalobacter barkolensis]PKD45161.1 steroid delta-isomerase [Rhodohalobacter barkolensis]
MDYPVQQQFEAFNNRDIDAFMESYAPKITVENGSGEEMMSGSEEIRTFYSSVFKNSPNLHCEIVNRTSVGDWVFDEEKIQGLNAEGFPEEAHAVVAYLVDDGQITFVRMYT